MNDKGSVPLLLDVAGRRVATIGAGPVAAGKTLPLADAGADVVVVAAEAGEAITTAAADGRLTWLRRDYRDGDLDAAWLAVAATADARVNDRVAADAAARRVWCVRVETGGSTPGSAAMPASVRHDPFVLAVSTGGASPALARQVRAELEQAYGPEYGALARLLGELRTAPEVADHLAGLSAARRRSAWRSVLGTDILSLVRDGQITRAKEVAAACLLSSSV